MRTLILLALALLTASALAESPTTAPSQLPMTNYQLPASPPGSRILKTFDFEELKLGNFEAIPMFWSKVQGPGFPAYSSGKFDHQTFRAQAGAAGGGTSFKLEIDGGSAAYRYSPGKLPINPNADYYILAYVKTTPLHHARAQISAFFADDKDALIKPAEIRFDSEPCASSKENAADWQLLHLYVPGPGNAIAAKSLVLQMGLLQPRQLPKGDAEPADLGSFALYQQDLKGAAWFDDITIIQLPRLSISVPPNFPANIFPHNQNIELDLSVSDIAAAVPAAAANVPSTTTAPAVAANVPATAADTLPPASEKLTVTLHVTDSDGLLFATEKAAIPAASTTPWTSHFTHAPLPTGLYLASLEVADHSVLIARRQTRFVCLGPALTDMPKPAADFGFTVSPADSTESWSNLPQILRHTKIGLVQLPAWRLDMSEEALLRRDPPFDSLLAALQRLDVHAIASFPQIPAVLSAKFAATTQAKTTQDPGGLRTQDFSPDSILALARADTAIWRPYVSFLLARYGNRIDFWEFGSLAEPYSGAASVSSAAPDTPVDQRYSRLFAKTSAEMATLVDRERLIIPWNALFDFDAKRFPNAHLDLRLPASIKPSQIPAYIDNFKQSTGEGGASATLFAHIDPLDEKRNGVGGVGHALRLADFAQRIVFARSASPTAVLVDLPVSQNATLGSFASHPEPDELLVAYRTLVQAMGNSDRVRELALAPGVKTFLFSRNNQDTLIMWSETDSIALLDLPLGRAPKVTDLLGTTRPLPLSAETQLAHLIITHSPIVVHNIDSRPVQLRASFSLAAATFPAGAGAARTEILLTNPYAETIAGTLKLSPPDGWSADPPSIAFSLAPGKSLREPVAIRYPFNQYAGAASITGRLKLDSGASYDLFAPVSVKSDLVELDASSQFMPNGDLVIQQVITNIGNVPINAQAYVLVPGYPREQRYIVGLAPRQTIIKRFTLPLASCVTAPKDTDPDDLAALLAGKTAAIGLRENDGRTLITRALPLQ